MNFKRCCLYGAVILSILGVMIVAQAEKAFFKTVKLNKGKSVVIFGQTSLRLNSHSHKRTGVGQESPLIVYLDYVENAKLLETKQFNVSRDKKKIVWRGLNIVFLRSDYDRWSELSITSDKDQP